MSADQVSAEELARVSDARTFVHLATCPSPTVSNSCRACPTATGILLALRHLDRAPRDARGARRALHDAVCMSGCGPESDHADRTQARATAALRRFRAREVATVAEPSRTRRRTTIICEPDYRPGTRDECPNPLHDHPLPDGYIAASDVAAARLRRGWANPRCPDCGLCGWRRGGPLGEPYEPGEARHG